MAYVRSPWTHALLYHLTDARRSQVSRLCHSFSVFGTSFLF